MNAIIGTPAIRRFKSARRLACAVFPALLLLGCSGAISEQPAQTNLTIKPDPEIQTLIQRALNPKDEEDLREQLNQLAKIRRSDRDRLVAQLLYYSMYGKDPTGRRDVKEAMVLGILGEKLHVSQQDIAFALWPYLGTEDPALKRELSQTFGALPIGAFSAIIRFRISWAHEPPYELIRFMFQRNPGEALLALRSTALLTGTEQVQKEKWRSLLWAEHVVSDVLWKHQYGFLPKTKVEPEAMAQLEKLSNDDLWWVRLYVAEILRQHPAFRTPELVARLAADNHALVRETIDFTKEKPKASAKPPAGKAPPPPAKLQIREEPDKEPPTRP